MGLGWSGTIIVAFSQHGRLSRMAADAAPRAAASRGHGQCAPQRRSRTSPRRAGTQAASVALLGLFLPTCTCSVFSGRLPRIHSFTTFTTPGQVSGRAERVNAGRADSGPRTRPLFIKKRATGTRSALASGQKDRGANDCRCTQSAKVGFTVQWPYSGLGTQLSAASLLLRHKRRIAWTARQDAAAALPHSASPPVLLRPALGPAAHAPVDLLPQGAARPLPAACTSVHLAPVGSLLPHDPVAHPPPSSFVADFSHRRAFSAPDQWAVARPHAVPRAPSRAPAPCRGTPRCAPPQAAAKASAHRGVGEPPAHHAARRASPRRQPAARRRAPSRAPAPSSASGPCFVCIQ